MSTVHFLLDELAVCGHMDSIDDAVGIGRGYGIRLQIYLQDLAQAKKCFPLGQEVTLLGNSTQVFFGVNENSTADYVSARLGEHTIVVDSGGTSRGNSYQTSHCSHPATHSVSYNYSSNWSQQARKLLKPEEVMALSPRTAITFAPGVPPIATTLLRSYEEQRHEGVRGWLERTLAAGRTLLASAALLAIAIGVAVSLTNHLEAMREASWQYELPSHYEPRMLNERRRVFRRREGVHTEDSSNVGNRENTVRKHASD